jgi:hypothetical protein
MLAIVPVWLIAMSTCLSVALGLIIGWCINEFTNLGQVKCNCCPVHDHGETNWAKLPQAEKHPS